MKRNILPHLQIFSIYLTLFLWYYVFIMKITTTLLFFIVLGLVTTFSAYACQGTSEPVQSQFPPQEIVQPVNESSS